MLPVLLLLMMACNQQPDTNKDEAATDKTNTVEGSYGALITEENAVPVSEVKTLLANNDTLQVKLKGEIAACCQNTGCWMDLEMANGDTLTVTFSNSDFVIPTDSKGKTTYIEGVARKELQPVEKLRNMAAEQGKSKEEIAAINEPQWAYTFEAKGVLIKEDDE